MSSTFNGSVGAKRPSKRFLQFLLTDGLCQMDRNAKLPGALHVAALSRRGEHQDNWLGGAAFVPDSIGYHETIHFRHVAVENDYLKWTLMESCLSQSLQGRCSSVDDGHVHFPIRHDIAQDAAIGGVVVDDQDTAPRQLDGLCIRDFRNLVALNTECGRKVEMTAKTGFAFDPDSAAHQRHQPGADG